MQQNSAGTCLVSQQSTMLYAAAAAAAAWCRSELLVTVAPITLRAAFSNIRTWNILQADMQLAGQVRQQAGPQMHMFLATQLTCMLGPCICMPLLLSCGFVSSTYRYKIH